jgi:hypothetical protein
VKQRLRNAFFAAIAIAFGLVVLAGYFINDPAVTVLRDVVLRWAVILAAVALLVGLWNLSMVHWGHFTSGKPGGMYSLITLIAMLATMIIAGFFGPTSAWAMWIFNYIQSPVEMSLMALLAVTLAYALARLFNRRLNLFSLVFAGTALVLLATAALTALMDVPGLADIRIWIIQVWATAGARGILLGVALGTIAVGLRVLLGSERPYGG